MNFKRSPQKRRERHINTAIRLQAEGAADRIIDLLNDQKQPPYRLIVDSPVEDLTREDYSRQVGQKTLDLLGVDLRTVPLEYDPVASSQATSDFIAVTRDTRPSKTPDPVIVVFNELPAPS